jgi:AcrR family transcriptional regulator
MTEMLDAAHRRSGGLRERKKARTRASIREHALRLFREQGYQATTVEQIAAAAEVSPSTFFRYFPTKEDVIFQDDVDVLTHEAFKRQPPGLSIVAAYRAAAAQALAALSPEDQQRFRETAAMTITIPEVRARALDEFTRTIDATAEVIAERTGRAPDDLAVRALAGALTGIIMGATMPWDDLATRPVEDLFKRVDEALALFEAGLPL